MLCLEDKMNNEIDFRTLYKNVELAKIRAIINGLALAIKNNNAGCRLTKLAERLGS